MGHQKRRAAKLGSTRRPRRAYHHGDLRAALVEAAAALVATRGPGAVTLREVGKRAGVSHAAPYHHFADKDALMAAVAEEGFRRFDAAQAAALDALRPGATPLERFEALGRNYVGFARENAHFLDVMFRSGEVDISEYPGLSEVAGRTFQRLAQAVAAVVGRSDPDAPDVMTSALFAWSTVHGFAMLWLHGRIKPGLGDSDEAVSELLRHISRGLPAARL